MTNAPRVWDEGKEYMNITSSLLDDFLDACSIIPFENENLYCEP